MKRCCDQVLEESEGNVAFLDLQPGDVTAMTEMCVERLAETNKCLFYRLKNLKSHGLFVSQKEPKFVKGLMAFWFARK